MADIVASHAATFFFLFFSFLENLSIFEKKKYVFAKMKKNVPNRHYLLTRALHRKQISF